MLNRKNSGDLLDSLSDDFLDGSFVRVRRGSESSYFELAEDSKEAEIMTQIYNQVTSELKGRF